MADFQEDAQKYGALTQAQDYSQASWWSGAKATFAESWAGGALGVADRLISQNAADSEGGAFDAFGGYVPSDTPSRRTVSADEAGRQAREMGIANIDFGKSDHTPEAVQLMLDGELDRRRQADTVKSSGIGAISRVVIGLGAGIADPLNLALAFTPLAPEILVARIAAAATLPARVAARAAVGAVEGAAGAAILEPFSALATTQEGRDYGVANALTNLMYGAGFGAALHPLAGSIGDMWAARASRGAELPQPGNIAASLHSQAHEQVMTAAARDLAEGRPVRAGDAIKELADKDGLRRVAAEEASRLLTEEQARAPQAPVEKPGLSPEDQASRDLELRAAATREEELFRGYAGDSNAVRQAGAKVEAIRRLVDEEAVALSKTGRYYVEAFQNNFAKFELSQKNFLQYVDMLVKAKRAQIIDEQTGKPFKLTASRLKSENAPGTFILFADKAAPRPDVPIPYERDVLRDRAQAKAQPAAAGTPAKQDTSLAAQVLVSQALRRDGPDIANVSERHAWWMQRLTLAAERKKKDPSTQAEADYTKRMRDEAGVKPKTTHANAARKIAEYERAVVAAERTHVPEAEPAVRDDPLEDEGDFLRELTQEQREDPQYKLDRASIADARAKEAADIDIFAACLLGEDDA